MGALESRFVGVVRVAEDRDVGPSIDDFLRLHARDVGDDEVGRINAVARHEPLVRKEPLQLSTEEEIDPNQQDRGHAWKLAARPDTDNRRHDPRARLVHVAVAWLHAERGNRNGCERQLVKAERRLTGYRPSHRGVDVDRVLEDVRTAQRVVDDGSLPLTRPRI
jgi:hypothetical protein